MKKNLLTLIVLLVLTAIAYYVYTERGSGTIKQELHDFAVQDTAAITKIFLANKSGQQVLLNRKSQTEWLVNKDHKARKDAIDVLLKTIMRVEMKAPVAKSAHDNIVKLMAGKSTKVEIYQGDEKVKTYYVSDATKDNMGTYMLIEGSSTPFICHIPGFTGYLSGRYMTRDWEWRDTEIFAHRLSQIAEVKLDFHQEPERSFKIMQTPDRVVSLSTLYPEKEVENMDTTAVKRYLLAYKNIRFEGIQKYDEERVDSIVNSPPYYTITLTDNLGEKHSVTSYRLPANPGAIDANDEPLIWDPDRMHAVVDGNEDEIMLIQYFSFDRLTIPWQYLVAKPGTEAKK